MALNQKYDYERSRLLPVAVGVVSGAPCLVGQIPGVALINRRADGLATVRMTGGFNLSVKGSTNAAANSAVAVGDILYYTEAATPKLNKDTTGVRFGYAMKAIAAGATATIEVKLGY